MSAEIWQEWHEMILLPKEVLENSPSKSVGIPEDVEVTHRIFACELIQEAGILLRQPQVVMATAQNLLHRFYYRRALTSENAEKRFYFDAFTVAMGCVFLASKLEEKPRAPRDVIFVFHHMCRRRRGLPTSLLEVTSERYHDLREVLLNMEKYILKELGFGFYNIMDHPHKFILYYIKALGSDADLAQRAWNYLNDSLRLDCCVRYRAELVACAAIFMAARDLQVKLPDNPPWWDLFGTELKAIKRVCNRILSLYHRTPVRWLEPLHPNTLVSAPVLSAVEAPAREEVEGSPLPAAGEREERQDKERDKKGGEGDAERATGRSVDEVADEKKARLMRIRAKMAALHEKGKDGDAGPEAVRQNGLEGWDGESGLGTDGTPMSVLSREESERGSGATRRRHGQRRSRSSRSRRSRLSDSKSPSRSRRRRRNRSRSGERSRTPRRGDRRRDRDWEGARTKGRDRSRSRERGRDDRRSRRKDRRRGRDRDRDKGLERRDRDDFARERDRGGSGKGREEDALSRYGPAKGGGGRSREEVVEVKRGRGFRSASRDRKEGKGGDKVKERGKGVVLDDASSEDGRSGINSGEEGRGKGGKAPRKDGDGRDGKGDGVMVEGKGRTDGGRLEEKDMREEVKDRRLPSRGREKEREEEMEGEEATHTEAAQPTGAVHTKGADPSGPHQHHHQPQRIRTPETKRPINPEVERGAEEPPAKRLHLSEPVVNSKDRQRSASLPSQRNESARRGPREDDARGGMSLSRGKSPGQGKRDLGEGDTVAVSAVLPRRELEDIDRGKRSKDLTIEAALSDIGEGEGKGTKEWANGRQEPAEVGPLEGEEGGEGGRPSGRQVGTKGGGDGSRRGVSARVGQGEGGDTRMGEVGLRKGLVRPKVRHDPGSVPVPEDEGGPRKLGPVRSRPLESQPEGGGQRNTDSVKDREVWVSASADEGEGVKRGGAKGRGPWMRGGEGRRHGGRGPDRENADLHGGYGEGGYGEGQVARYGGLGPWEEDWGGRGSRGGRGGTRGFGPMPGRHRGGLDRRYLDAQMDAYMRGDR